MPGHSDVPTAALANLLGVSTRAVRDLAERGIIERAGRGWCRLEPSVRRYCEELRRAASARGGEAGLAKIREEWQRLLSAQAAAVERRNRAAAGELVEAAAVEAEWAAILRTVRAEMLALPSRVGARLPHLGTADLSEVDLLIHEVLTDLGGG